LVVLITEDVVTRSILGPILGQNIVQVWIRRRAFVDSDEAEAKLYHRRMQECSETILG
jgi:hypothetical protein